MRPYTLLSFVLLMSLAFAGCEKENEEESLTGSFTDPRDGQVYTTIKIGNHVWFAENLRYTGNIPEVSGRVNWAAIFNNGNPTEQPAWCYYGDDPMNDLIYGKLYNAYAVNTGSLCPTGLAYSY